VSKVDTVDCPQHQEGREPAFGEISSRWEAENTYAIFCDECLGPETAYGCSGSANAGAPAENYVRGVDTGGCGFARSSDRQENRVPLTKTYWTSATPKVIWLIPHRPAVRDNQRQFLGTSRRD
jgi:hypothetical protein